MREPVTPKWLLGRVATLQAQYYTTNLPEAMQEAIAEDWYQSLKQYPAWSIANAVRWYMSKDNPQRKSKPICGDIEERCHIELANIRYAEHAVSRFDWQTTSLQ